MARRKNSRRRGMGSTIQVRQLSGTERINNPSSITGAALPVLLGGGAALLTSLGIRKYVEPTADNAMIVDNAEWFGMGAGALTGLALYHVASKPAGVAASLAAVVVELATLLPLWMTGGASAAPGTAGLGRGVRAIVPEYSMRGLGRGRGTGAVAMQSQASRGYGRDAGGESLSLGAINPGAFGTPGFRMGR